MHRLLTAVVMGGLLFAGCGGEDSAPEAGSPAEGKRGGKLTMLWTDDVDNIDLGITYYQMGYLVSYATQRPLYSYRPDDGERAVRDLAEADPQVSQDGKTVTVTIREGVRFSPLVNREVTAEDVKYAIERGFFNTATTASELLVEEHPETRAAVLEGAGQRGRLGRRRRRGSGDRRNGAGPRAAGGGDRGDHPLVRFDRLDGEMLAATPRVGGPQSRVTSLSAQLAMAAAGEGYALVPALATTPGGVVLRSLAGTPEWELRTGRPAREVLSVGTLAAFEALRKVSVSRPTASWQASGRAVGAQ